MTRFVFFSCVLAISTLQAQEPKEPTTEQLIAQLGHKTFAVREKAMVALRAKGPVVLPDLKKALAGPDAEVRERLQVLIPELEKVAALTPKKVTLNEKQQTVTAIAKNIEAQTGFKMSVHVTNTKNELFDIECKDLPFWEAMHLVQERTGYGVATSQYDQSLRLQMIPVPSKFFVNHGPVRLELHHLHEDRDFFFKEAGVDKQAKQLHLLSLNFKVMSEMRHNVYSVGEPIIDAALDENGKAYEMLKKDGNTEYSSSRWGAMFIADSQIRLRRGHENAKTIRELKGTIPVQLVIEKRKVLISDNFEKANGTTFRVGNDTLKLTQVKMDGGNPHMEMTVPAQDGRRDANNWHERVILEDAAGLKYSINGRGTSSSGNNDYRISVYFGSNGNKIGPPAKLFIEDWVTVVYPVPFTFKDIPLP